MNGVFIGTPIGGVLNVTSVLTADYGSLSLSGQAALFQVSQAAAQGAFSLTGQSALFAVSQPSAGGSYTLTGQSVTFRISAALANGAFQLTGQDASFHTDEPQAFGSFTLSGQPATFTVTAAEDYGSFALSGDSEFNITLAAEFGSFVLEGQVSIPDIEQPPNTGGVVQPAGQFSRSRWRKITEEEARKRLEAEQEAEWAAERARVARQLKLDTERKEKIAKREAKFSAQNEQLSEDLFKRLGLAANDVLGHHQHRQHLSANVAALEGLMAKAKAEREEEEEMAMLLVMLEHE